MGKDKNTAVYIDKLTNGHLHQLDINDLKSFVAKLDSVSIVWENEEIPVSDAQAMSEAFKAHQIHSIIIAGYDPGFLKPLFCKAFAMAGGDPQNVLIANLDVNGDHVTERTVNAKALLTSLIYKISENQITSKKVQGVKSDTLVIGGGIAGIQSALELANGNLKVHLVEKTGTIGGHMAMFDKTFPTLDCAACILTPKMVEVGQHTNINLMTYCEVQEVTGEPGDFKVKVLKKARRILESKCIGCGTCAEKCPSKVYSEFDANTTLRRAAYIPFPQAVPNKYLIDAENCIYVKNGKCGVCVKVCPVPDCIDLDQKDEIVELNVGNIIVATGFKTFDAARIDDFGYGKYPNVLTSIEFERLVNASGPTGGNISFRNQDKKGNWIFTDNGKYPEKVAFIHCVGSRDENYNKYCSKVCCMYSLKLAHLVKEKLPNAEVSEYYIDMRAFGKGYEEFYERIKEEGVHVIRGRTAKVEQKNEMLVLRSEDIEGGRLIEQEVDMVVLSVGLEPSADSRTISEMLNIKRDADGWFEETNLVTNPVDTERGGVYVAGVCQGPKDIPDTVAQASAAASKVIQNIMNDEIEVKTDGVLQNIQNIINTE